MESPLRVFFEIGRVDRVNSIRVYVKLWLYTYNPSFKGETST